MIKGVIFDVDGVLLNSMPVWENLGELYLDHLGIEAEKNLGETLFEMSLEEAADYLISHYNLEKTVEEVVQGLNKEVEDYYAKRVPLKEGVRQYLEEFRERKIPMVIATTGDRKNAEAALSRLKVLPYFQGVFTASEIGSGKDQPDIYFAALLQLDTEPEQTWVFEDTYQALRTAKHAGFKTVAVYDKANDKNLAQIWNTADIYLPEFDDFNVFWLVCLVFREGGCRHQQQLQLHFQARGKTVLHRYEPFLSNTYRYGTVQYRRRLYMEAHRSAVPSGMEVLHALHIRLL